MSRAHKIEFNQLEVGYQFPSRRFHLDEATISDYLKAVEDGNRLYQENDLVPPLAVAAYAMKALAEEVALPPGTIHISQELQFGAGVAVGERLTSQARVTRKQTRAKLHLLNVELSVYNQYREAVLGGTTSFMLPVADGEEGL